jgi:hypothetical protein
MLLEFEGYQYPEITWEFEGYQNLELTGDLKVMKSESYSEI